jgi:hypothetical protein
MLLAGAFHCLRREFFDAAAAAGTGSEPADLDVERVVGGGMVGDAGVRKEAFEFEGGLDAEDGEFFLHLAAFAPETCKLKFCSRLS